MQRARRWMPAIAATALVAMLCSCAGKVETRSKPNQREDERETTTNANFHASGSSALLEQARQALSLGQYDRALEGFRSVSTNAGAKPEHRADALFGMGQVYSNVLNPKRDVDKAVAAYQQLVADYPDSPRREEAERAIASLRAAQP